MLTAEELVKALRKSLDDSWDALPEKEKLPRYAFIPELKYTEIIDDIEKLLNDNGYPSQAVRKE